VPEKSYNKSLADFDHFISTLLDGNADGMIILIETFGGKRNYYFYTSPAYDLERAVKKMEIDFNVKLKVTAKQDIGWGSIKKYPVELCPE
jgi:hypothetical protein